MPARLRIIFVLGVLLVASACSKSAATVTKTVNNTDKDRLSVVSIRTLSTSIGPVVVGEIRNNSAGPVSGVRVTAALKDRQGAEIGEHLGFTLLKVVPAGQKASFSIPFTGGNRAVGSVSATVASEPKVSQALVALKVDSPEPTVLGSDYEVSGTVVNSTQTPVRFTNVVATFYDKGGEVVGSAHDVSSGDEIAPGQSATFLVVLVEQARLVASYTLAAEGQVVDTSH